MTKRLDKQSARTVNEALNAPQKKQRTQRQQWISRYESELGLRPGSKLSNGVVADATCKFCSAFGREDSTSQGPSLFADLLAKPKRQKTARVKVFTSFRRDNILAHMRDQHSRRWEEFTALPHDGSARTEFFSTCKTIKRFLPTSPCFDFRVPAGVVYAIKRIICDSHENAVELDGFVELEDGDNLIQIKNREQFEVVLRCITAPASYRSVTKLFLIFGEALSNMKLGKPNEQVVRQYVSYVIAINLTALRTLTERVWAFSIMVDGASHASRGYLDVRLSFALLGGLHNFHLLAIPTGDRAHTARNYADLVLATLRSVFGSMALTKLIGIATDGAATMIGCKRGFVKQIKDACESAGGGGIVANWCGSHQLNLVVDDMLTVFDAFVSFRSRLGYEIAFTRVHESVRQRIGSCPTYASTRWDSIYKSCQFLMTNYLSLLELQEQKQRDKSSPLWWLCLFLVADMSRALKLCFATMQYKNVTMRDQIHALNKLRDTFQSRFEEDNQDGVPTLSEMKIECEINHASAFSRQLYDTIDNSDQQQLILAVRDAVQAVIDGITAIQLTVEDDIPPPTLTSPRDLFTCNDSEFAALVERHKGRLATQHGSVAITNIWTQRKDFVDEYRSNRKFQKRIDRISSSPATEAWEDDELDRRFGDVKQFVLGLASIPPGTHTVESDFSNLKRVKCKHRSRLSDVSLEGELQASQYAALMSLVESTTIDKSSEVGSKTEVSDQEDSE